MKVFVEKDTTRTAFFGTKNCEVPVWHSTLHYCLQHWHPTGAPVQVPAVLLLTQLSISLWEGSGRWFNGCHPHGKTRWSSRLPVLTLPRPSWPPWLSGERARGWKISVPTSSSLCKFAFRIDKSFGSNPGSAPSFSTLLVCILNSAATQAFGSLPPTVDNQLGL